MLRSGQTSYFSSWGAGEAARTPLFSLEEGAVEKGWHIEGLAEVSIQHLYTPFCLLPPFLPSTFSFPCIKIQIVTTSTKTERAHSRYLLCTMYMLDRNLLSSLVHSAEPDCICWVQDYLCMPLRSNTWTGNTKEWAGRIRPDHPQCTAKCQPRREVSAFPTALSQDLSLYSMWKTLDKPYLAYPKAICELDLYY